MPDQDQRILDVVFVTLGSEEMTGAIVYLRAEPLSRVVQLEVGDAVIDAPWDAHVVFVDLDPGANWGHACCYLAIRQDSEDVVTVPARMPPFLKAGSTDFHLLWRGPLAPDWAVVEDG